MEYKIKYDYHTHTTYSHGKGTIAENVRVAFEKGLSGIAISDHGPGHLFYGVRLERIQEMRKEIDEQREIYKDMDIFLSVEANIIHAGTGLDVDEQAIGAYDFVIAGYHFGVKNGYCGENFFHNLSNIALSGKKNLLTKNTDMAVKAIYENPIKILTHPGGKGIFDIVEIAKACADRGTLLEISAHHKQLTIEQIKQVSKIDVQFIVSSDAHVPGQVGSCEPAIRRAMEAGLDMDRIVNIERR
ncbi:MAG: PHP domain-containing protein [Clostridiales bacterium]|nr:PHP domain-containing protein [Clostridiales bacterium]